MLDAQKKRAASASPPRHEFRFRYDRALVSAAYRPLFVQRSLWFVAIVGAMVGVNWILGGETPRLLWITVAAFTVLVLARLWQVWRQSVRRTLARWSREAPDGEITVQLADDAVRVRLGTETTRYGWDGLLRLKRRPSVWALEIVEHRQVLFPPDAASPEARDYLVERCRAAGAKT